MQFKEDGTLRVDIPDGLLAAVSLDPEAFDWSSRYVAEGTWSISDALRGAPQEVDYILTASGRNVIGKFYVEGHVGSRKIIEDVGLADDDDPFVFEKTS